MVAHLYGFVNKWAEGEISITFDLDTLGECFQSFQAVTSPEKEKLTLKLEQLLMMSS